MKRVFFVTVIAFSLFACKSKEATDDKMDLDQSEETEVKVINHSYGNIDDIHTTDLHLDLEVDFNKHVIKGVARHKMFHKNGDVAIFDTDDLTIEKVTIGKKGSEKETTFIIGESDSLLGEPLIVDIKQNTRYINIYYATSPEAKALDWLAPEKTESNLYPYLYTQGEAILTRSWIPIQDNPSNRFTYSADVKVPNELLALMSASNPTEKNKTGEYSFQMKQPIPSYLVALAVGEIEYVDLGNDCGIYAEPNIVDQAAKEFKDIPKMVEAAESIYGEYLWGKYDVLILPYSFPFGGMENPRLTFATPTLIAGDGSLVSVIAHELAHSWSGNLVTNASWEDFWLNEGFTVYIENRIMEKLYGKEVADMLAIIEYQELLESVDNMIEEGRGKDTHLKLDLDGRDPDDGMTDIAYVKGCFFLKTIESKVGRETFDNFLRTYFQAHKFESLTTEEFLEYLEKNLIEKKNIDFNVDEWVYGKGIPDNVIELNSNRFEIVQKLADTIKKDGNLPTALKREDKITQEWLAFIRGFNDELVPEKMKEIDEQLHFKDCGNAEIMAEWFVLGIHSGYDEIKPDVKAFLIKVGRRKFLTPIYTALENSDRYREWGKDV